MLEWKRFKAVRRLAWVAIGLAIFLGAFFMVISAVLIGWFPEALLGLYPATLMGAIALALHRFEPEHPPVQEQWRPERELITPLPRQVEAKWSTPRATLPLLLWLFPIFWLAMVVAGVRPFEWSWLSAVSAPPLVVTLWVFGRHLACRDERALVRDGVIARGKIRRIVHGQGTFRLKIEYQFDGADFFSWTENLSPKTWFGPLLAEERRFVTLLVDPDAPERFVVYPFSSHLVSTRAA